MPKNSCYPIVIIIILVVCIIAVSYLVVNSQRNSADGFAHSKNNKAKTIRRLTDKWIQNVTEKKDPDAIAKMFCKDGNLVGTVSQEKRKGRDIKRYFDYFANLPGLKVVDKEYNISKIVPSVYLNTAFITWHWKGLEKPIVARMTFIFRNKCIFQLHSSALPELNTDLKKISGSS
jgi:hypothetical protein